jgi:hypothetical protein
MAAALYDKGREAFANGAINWVSDTIKVAFLGAGYTANMTTDQYLSTTGISGATIATATLANKTNTAGVCDADDVLTGNLATGSTITQVIGYKDTGVAGTSPLIFREDLTSTPTNGGTVSLAWDNAANKIFKL